jgi:hypothetical protein
MAFRDDLVALDARHTALEAEVARKEKERDEARRLLEDAKSRARLPVLENIRVAAPCHVDWAQMTGDERKRHCGDCKKTVYNLSGMTRDEAEHLLVTNEGALCVRYFQRHDGTILLADCVVGAKRRRRRKLVMIAGATAMLAGAGVAAYTKLASHVEEFQPVMGEMAVSTEPHSYASQLGTAPVQATKPAVAKPAVAKHRDGQFVMGLK